MAHKDHSIVALIPARSGSKRIPDKNIRPLAGHPLIAYTIAAALDSGMKGVVVTVNEYTRNQDFSGCSLVLNHLGEFDEPCRVLAGNLSGANMLDVAALRRLHRQVHVV